jgi:hypothetical protein
VKDAPGGILAGGISPEILCLIKDFEQSYKPERKNP